MSFSLINRICDRNKFNTKEFRTMTIEAGIVWLLINKKSLLIDSLLLSKKVKLLSKTLWSINKLLNIIVSVKNKYISKGKNNRNKYLKIPPMILEYSRCLLHFGNWIVKLYFQQHVFRKLA